MRIATWNCQSGLTSNWPAIEALDVDVITMQECGDQTEVEARARGSWKAAHSPGRWGKGVGVLARAPYEIEREETSEPFIVSTIVSGPRRFRFVGFWAMTEKDVDYSYPRQATILLDTLPNDDLDTVVAGDFNASKSAQHLANVARLKERGLVSAYHSRHGVAHDAVEAHPTSFHLWSEGRPFHMDFVFVPAAWTIEAVDVGTFVDYAATRISDHMPVVVTVVQPG